MNNPKHGPYTSWREPLEDAPGAPMRPTRFDELSSSYEDLLRDPFRDRFTGQDSAFFHRSKNALIRRFFQRRNIDTSGLCHLDAGCGKGELLSMLRADFKHSAGCDVSVEM